MDQPTVHLLGPRSIGKDPTEYIDPPTERMSVAVPPPGVSPAAQEPRPPGRRDVRRSALHLVLAAGVLPLVSLATGPLLARFLGPEDRGYLSAILAAVNLIPYVLALGLVDASTYLVARRKQPVGAVALVTGLLQLVLGVLGAAVLWVLAPVILAGYGEGVLLMQLVALTVIPAMALRAVSGARMGEGRYDLLIAERWIAGISRLLLLVLLAITGALTVATAAWVQVGVLLVAQLALLVGLSRPRGSWRRARALGAAGYSYGMKSWPGELAAIVIARLDQVIMVPLAGAVQLGYYAIAVSLAEVPKALFSDLRTILLSEVATHRDPEMAARACRMSVIAITAPVLVFMAITPIFLPLLFGEDFAPAVLMAEILLAATIPSGVNIFIAGSISALGRPGLQSWARAVGVVIVVVGLFALVPILGGVGAALVTTAATVVTTGILAYAFWRVTHIGPLRVLIPTRADVRMLIGLIRRRRR